MNASALVLVDSSVWIDFFRHQRDSTLSNLIKENLVCTNELILTELIPSLQKNRNNDIIEGLFSLENIPLNIDWEGIRNYQLINIQNGLNKVGIPDLIILQQTLEYKMELYTLDKHFELMTSHFSLQLFDD